MCISTHPVVQIYYNFICQFYLKKAEQKGSAHRFDGLGSAPLWAHFQPAAVTEGFLSLLAGFTGSRTVAWWELRVELGQLWWAAWNLGYLYTQLTHVLWACSSSVPEMPFLI